MAFVDARICLSHYDTRKSLGVTQVCAEDFSSNVMEATNVFMQMPCGSWRILAALLDGKHLWLRSVDRFPFLE